VTPRLRIARIEAVAADTALAIRAPPQRWDIDNFTLSQALELVGGLNPDGLGHVL
jgi:hypothetical protein